MTARCPASIADGGQAIAYASLTQVRSICAAAQSRNINETASESSPRETCRGPTRDKAHGSGAIAHRNAGYSGACAKQQHLLVTVAGVDDGDECRDLGSGVHVDSEIPLDLLHLGYGYAARTVSVHDLEEGADVFVQHADAFEKPHCSDKFIDVQSPLQYLTAQAAISGRPPREY